MWLGIKYHPVNSAVGAKVAFSPQFKQPIFGPDPAVGALVAELRHQSRPIGGDCRPVAQHKAPGGAKLSDKAW
jgi:hypothetical protein